jgi:hypothetical protein
MIPKTKGAEDSCPSCHQILVCREKEYKGETSLQWQYKDREEAHFSFDFKTKKSACKESVGGSQASTVQSSVATDKLNLDGISLPGDQVAQITQTAAEMTERMLCVFNGVQRVCNNAGITHPATIGMIFNQVCENRRSE